MSRWRSRTLLPQGPRLASLLLALLLMNCAGGRTDPELHEPPSREFRELAVIPNVSAEATDSNGQRKLALAPDGTLYLAFVAPTDGVDRVFVTSSADEGLTWREPVRLSREGIRAGLPSIATDDGGDVHVAWVDYETVGHVWYSRLTAGVWKPGSKISPGPNYAGLPVLAAKPADVDVLWYATRPDDASAGHGSIYEIRHTRNVNGQWSDPGLLSSGTFDALNPTLAQDESGAIHAAWYERTGPPESLFEPGRQSYRVHYALLNGDRSEDRDVISPAESDATAAAVEVGPNGDVHLVWSQFVAGVPKLAYSRRSRSHDSWSDPLFVSEGPTTDPVVATDGLGIPVVAWTEEGRIHIASPGASSPTMLIVGSGRFPVLMSGIEPYVAWTRQVGSAYQLVIGRIFVSR